jgi:two-component system chemotaxis response regulator CheB/chemosensory pili system protein ChpB (putative protein-glutamate methylesterase)
VAVALLYESAARSQHLRETLTTLGTPIVYEAAAKALDRDALARSHANVVIVNLDDEDSPDLDAVYSLLDDVRYKVVFNDSGVSNGLSGWDHARWVRHLSAKVLGDADIDPPRPADAEPVPVRARSETPAAPPAAPIAAATVAEASPLLDDWRVETKPAEAIPASATALPDIDLSEIADLLQGGEPIETFATAPEKKLPDIEFDDLGETRFDEPVEERIELSGIDDLLADFDMPNQATPPSPLSAESMFGDEFAIDLSSDIPQSTLASSESVTPAEVPSDFDLDFDLDDIPVAATTPAATPTAKSEPVTVLGGASAWSLEDIEDETSPGPVPTGPAQFGIEKVSASEYLAPEGGAEESQPSMPSLSELSLELIPLEEAVAPTPVERPDTEAWLDPDQVKAKIRRVWVLGASVGGPESVREFLSEFPRDYPALFLLAQHLGDEFVDMMAKQLSRATQLTVRTPSHGERVAHGDIVIVPNTFRMQIDPMGVVLLEKTTREAAYRPSINLVLEDTANRYGEAAGAIVFSGMSDDAVTGCEQIAARGGRVYVQSPESCVVSTMVDAVNETGVVSFIGTPKELAAKLLAERT